MMSENSLAARVSDHSVVAGLPSFLIIGAHKGGTTSFFNYIGGHPDVFIPRVKEPRFFALENDPLDYRGPQDPAARCEYTTWEQYRTLFDCSDAFRASGEASTLYLYSDDAATRIARYLPDVRIIAMLRNPAERAYSNFVYARRDGREPLESFEEALAEESNRIALRWGPLWHYRSKGFYGKQLQRYFSLFPESQIRVYLFEEFRKDPVAVTQDAYEFLGVDPTFVPNTSVRFNRSGQVRNLKLQRWLSSESILRSSIKKLIPSRWAHKMRNAVDSLNLADSDPLDASVRRSLMDGYADDIALLEKLLGRDLSLWLESSKV
ncbi:MAG: sulfotransferase [Rhodothermia bacterium]|nr:sulfotransferase [Rhodothermia bacterium]